MNKLLIGWSEVSITPNKKVSLSGQFAERISTYVEKKLTATAMAVQVGDEQMVLVSCDLVGVACNLVDAIRENLKGNTVGLDRRRSFSLRYTPTRVLSIPAPSAAEDILCPTAPASRCKACCDPIRST